MEAVWPSSLCFRRFAEVVHQRIIGRGSSRIKTVSTPSFEGLDSWEEVCWSWIRTHADYDKLLKRL
jgi:hypothetical protein